MQTTLSLARRNLSRPIERRETLAQFTARRAAVLMRRSNWNLLRAIHAELGDRIGR